MRQIMIFRLRDDRCLLGVQLLSSPFSFLFSLLTTSSTLLKLCDTGVAIEAISKAQQALARDLCPLLTTNNTRLLIMANARLGDGQSIVNGKHLIDTDISFRTILLLVITYAQCCLLSVLSHLPSFTSKIAQRRSALMFQLWRVSFASPVVYFFNQKELWFETK